MDQAWSEQQLQEIIQAGESNFVDFKQQWYDLTKDGKAELARDVLALANTAMPDHPGFLIIGVQDGGKVLGAGPPPTEEAISQILTHYIMPPVAFSVTRMLVSGQNVDLIEVPYSPYRPHHANREAKCLQTGVAYVRRGTTTGQLTVPEIAAMARESRFTVKSDPLELGFVEYINWNSGFMTARFTNLIDEPIIGLHLTMELLPRYKPDAITRETLILDATLAPRESREVKLKIFDIGARITSSNSFNPLSNLRHRWLDVTLHLAYRDRFGYIKNKSELISLA